MKVWLEAFRLRTLPLAFSCVIMGSGLAVADGHFNLPVLLLTLITSLFLQILSNLANDYGDFVKGTDNKERVGPERTLQAGLVTKGQMKKAIWLIALLCAIFGSWLIYKGTLGLGLQQAGLFAVLGLAAMLATVKYTMGKNPYGYSGFGDLFVFVFFGWVGVLGSYFLHAHTLYWKLLLPASAIGLLTTAVLNLNNMRDYIADEKNSKRTLVVKMGIEKSKTYHQLLVIGGLLLATAFVVPATNYFHYIFLLTVPLFLLPVLQIKKRHDVENFDPFLKKQVIATFLFTIFFVGGLNIHTL